MILPECGMFVGSCVYLDVRDYMFQHSGVFSRWVSEDHPPWWYLQKIIDDNQGNLAALFDGGASDRALKSMAYWMDLQGIGLTVPEPDWENKRHLVPGDWKPIREHHDRYGAGILRFARDAKKRGIYSFVVYGRSGPQWLKKTNRLGKWFLGQNLGESFDMDQQAPPDGPEPGGQESAEMTLADARRAFERSVRKHVRKLTNEGWRNTFVCSASFGIDYEMHAGVDVALPEDFAFCHLNVASAMARGLTRQLDRQMWGSHMAHEHFSFLPYRSKHKFQMLKAAMYLKYLSGAKMVVLESGNWWQQTIFADDAAMHQAPKPDFGDIADTHPRKSAACVAEARKHYKNFNYTSRECRRYRREISDFYDFVKNSGTPPGQPETTVAVVKGNLDGCGQDFHPNNAVWGAHDLALKNPQWFEGAPEMGWQIMNDVFFPRRNTLGEFRNKWFSGTPYGMIDIVSLNCPVTAGFLLKHYKALIMLGWNTATSAQYTLLKQYVRGGGKLFLGIPHLSRNVTREYRNYSVDDLVRQGRVGDLCGLRIKGRGRRYTWAMIANDPNPLNLPKGKRYGAFGTHVGDVELEKNVQVIAVDDESDAPVLIRHAYGNGCVYFLNSWEYPGALTMDTGPSATVASSGLVGEVLKTLARDCRGHAYITDDGRAVGPECDHTAYSYFPSSRTTYLLNIDANRAHTVCVHRRGRRNTRVRLKPFEFRAL
jgi:hypothetical protein